MMLRPVEFNSTGDPRTGQTYKCRFDHMIVVDEVIVICFVQGSLNTSA